MSFFTEIISGWPGLLFVAILWILVRRINNHNLYTPWSFTWCLFFKQCADFLHTPYTVLAKGQLFDSPTGAGLPSASYPPGFIPIVKSNRPDFSAFLSGSASKAGFLLGILFVFSFSTLHAASVSSSAAGGNWSDPSSWVGGMVPGNGDEVIIAAGSKVIINSDVTLSSLSVSGILEYESGAARTLTVTGIVTINSGGVFRSAQSGTIKNHRLIVHGSIINNGTIDFSANANETGVEIVFTGAGNAIFNCSDAPLTNLRSSNGLVLDKGTSAASVLSFNPGNNFRVQSDGSSNAPGFLSIVNGTFNIIGSKSFSNPVFDVAGSFTIPATGGFWLGNQNATVTAMDGTLTNLGDLKMTNGTLQVGKSPEHGLKNRANGQFKMTGGTIVVAGGLELEGGNSSISGGVLNLASHAKTVGAPAFSVSAQARLEIYGDPMITLTFPNSKNVPASDIQILGGSGFKSIKGGTIQLGTVVTPAGSTFLVNSAQELDNLDVFDECSIRVMNSSGIDLQQTPVDSLPLIVFDRTAPEFTAPPKITLKCGDPVSPVFRSLQEFTSAGGAASDNCTLLPASFKLSGQVQSSVGCPYTITRTYEVKDNSGNAGTAEHVIVVEGEGPQPEAVAENVSTEELKLKSAMAGTITSTATGGDWNVGSTWVGGVPPSAGDDVVIVAGATVSIITVVSCKSISLENGSSLEILTNGNLTCNQNLNLTINPNAKITINGGYIKTGASIQNDGTFHLISGTAEIGSSAGNELLTRSGAIFKMEGGTLNISGRLVNSAGEAYISGGTINLALLGQADSGTGTFHMSLTSKLTITGGSIILHNNSTAGAVPIDIKIFSGSGSKSITGGTFDLGSTSTLSGSIFRVDSPIAFYNFRINSPNATMNIVGNNLTVNNQLTMNGGNIDTGTQALIVTGSSSSSLSHSSGMVIGNLQRNVSLPGVDYAFPVGNGINSSTLKLNFASVTTSGIVTASSSGSLPSGFLLNQTTISAPIYISNNTVGFTTVSGSYQLPSGFTPSQKVGLYNSSWSYQPAAASVSFSGWNNINGSAFALADCTAPIITGTLNVCTGLTTQLTGSDSPAASSPWISGTPSVATVDNSGLVTGVSAGTSLITYTNNAGCQQTVTVTVNALPTISGTMNVCVGSTTALIGSATPDATTPWSSATTGVATVNASGVVTGISAGTSIITYKNSNGCIATTTITVNPLPTISGTLNVCVGSTTQLTGSATAAAVNPWVSGSTTIAMVNSTGLVTGVSAGTSVITYTNANGCTITATVTVNPLPTISGTLNVCVGSTTALTGSATSDATTPWASATTGVATVNASGVVTGVSAGISIITYKNNNGCTATATITVNPLPVPTVTGSSTACVGSTGNIYFTEPGMSGYVWTPSAGGTITSGQGTNSITVTWNVAASQAVQVSYTNGNGCTASVPTVKSVTVNSLPAAPTAGNVTVCYDGLVHTGSATPGSGGDGIVWYNAATGGSIVSAPGGTATGTYTAYAASTVSATGCESASRTAVTVIINPKPTVVITNSTLCSPADLTLASVTVGSTPGLSYTYWTNAAGTIPLSNYTTAGAGTYWIKGTVTSTLCYDIKPVTVNQTPVGTNTSVTICSGGNLNINLALSVPGSTFTWTVVPISGTVTVTGATSGSTLSQTLTSSGVGGTVVYRVTPTSISSGCVGAVYSITVTVNTKPTVTLLTEPEIAACERSYVNMTANYVGPPIPTSVQWQISSDNTAWSNLANGTDINGVTTNILELFIPNNAPSPRYYRAVYTNACGSTPSSSTKLITDNGPMINTDLPGTINGCAGGTITFTAKVTGAGAGNKPENRIYAWIQYLVGGTWTDVTGSNQDSGNSGQLDYSYSLSISNFPYGTEFRIYFHGKCGSVSTSTRVVYPTSVVTAPNGCVGTPINLSHDGALGGTWNIINSSGTIIFSLSNVQSQTLSYTPTAAGCYTAQYSTGSCNDAKQFVVFPALPSVPFVTSGCGSPVSLSAIPTYSGFNAEYAVQPPSGVMSSWETFAQAQTLLTNTAGCWTLKARYVLATDCGTILAGATTTATGCTEAVFNAFVFPAKPVLTVPSNTCASAFTLPSVPAISGFNVEYSINTATFTTTPVIPTTPGCHTIKARYVVAAACGTVPAGATGGVACESDPVSVVIFPLAPPAPTVTAGCGAFTVTPPASFSEFNIEYSFDNGVSWGANTPPTADNCIGYEVRTRYVLAIACGTTLAGPADSYLTCHESPATNRKIDTTPPAIVCNPAPAPVCVNTGITYVHSGTSWDATVTPDPDPSCTISSVFASLSGTTTGTNLTTLNNVAFNIGTTIVTWTASDGCNTSTCSFSVTVNPKPVINSITAPDLCSGGTFTITPVNGANGTVPAGTTYTWAAPVVAGITGATSGTNTNTISGTLNNTTATPIIVIYTVTPTSGAGCIGPDFTVTVTVNPILTCSIAGTSGPVCPNSTGNIFSSVAGMSNYTWSITGNGTISAGGSSQTVTVTAGGACNAPFILTLNYNDLSGCSSSCTQIVDVVDTTSPTITCQGGVTTNTNSGECIAAPVVLVAPTVSDGCTGSVTITNDAPAQYPIGVTIVTWTATDACGNYRTCTQTVTVIDNQAGTLSCIPSFQWPADDNELFATNVPIPQPSYTYSDNCGTYTLTWTLSGETTSNSVSTGINEIPAVYPRLNVGDNIFSYTVTDAGNNSVGCTFTVTVYSFPEIACQPGIVTDTSTNSCTSTFDPGVPDLIQGQPDITWTWKIDNPLSADGSGTTVTTEPQQVPQSIGKITFDHGTTTITWTATNAAGTASCTQIITVNDVIQPIYTPSPQPIDLCVENIISATYALGDPDVVKINPDPDYYLFHAGTDTYTLDLDLVNYLKDNCCPDVGTMTWTITFSAVPGNPATPGTIGPEFGQPSAYKVAGVPTDIKLWGNGVTYQPVNHTISYTVYDCHGNHSTFSRQITINPRPELTKMP